MSEKEGALRAAWVSSGVDGLWDEDCMLFGVGRDQDDPVVPESLRGKYRSIVDAEGEIICLVPVGGPYAESKNWPQDFVNFLNAASNLVSR